MTTPFSADAQRQNAATWIVTIAGELDLATAPELEAVFEALDTSASDRVLVDLAEVSFLDSSGIRALARAKRRLDGIGASLLIDAMSDAARQVLEISGMLDALSERPPDNDV